MHPIRLLLVDDSREMLEVLSIQYGLSPHVEVLGLATSRAQALDFLHHCSVDAVSMDIHLNRDDGIALCAELRRRYPWLFLVVSSILGESDVRQRALQAGANLFAPKPVTRVMIDQFVEAFRHFRRKTNDGMVIY